MYTMVTVKRWGLVNRRHDTIYHGGQDSFHIFSLMHIAVHYGYSWSIHINLRLENP